MLEPGRVDRVEPAPAVGPHAREAALAQDAEVTRHRGLRQPELGLDRGAHVTRRPLTLGEELEDAAADRVAEDVEGLHRARFAFHLI